MSYLTDEYKILQDKIDKIGAFRFTIKGWSVTATLAALAAISSGKILPPSVIASATSVLLLFFFIFEREQVRLGWGFNERARLIEIQIDKRRRQAAKEQVLTFSTPNIARASIQKKKKGLMERLPIRDRKLKKFLARLSKHVELNLKSHLLFYFALGLAAWLPCLLKTAPSASPSSSIQFRKVSTDSQTPFRRKSIIQKQERGE